MSAASQVLQVDRCNMIHRFYRKTIETEWSPAWEIDRLIVSFIDQVHLGFVNNVADKLALLGTLLDEAFNCSLKAVLVSRVDVNHELAISHASIRCRQCNTHWQMLFPPLMSTTKFADIQSQDRWIAVDQVGGLGTLDSSWKGCSAWNRWSDPHGAVWVCCF